MAESPSPPPPISAPVPQATLEIPAGMVRCSRINRPYIALKTGPGDQYPNQNSLLKKGTEVVLTYETPVWHKIYVPTLKLSGWVHSKALGPSFKNPKTLNIHTNHLSIITTVQKTVRVYPASAGKPTLVTVPRGLTLARLAVESQKQLVWLTMSPNVLWIDRRDAW